jgi:dihydropteroate synthase
MALSPFQSRTHSSWAFLMSPLIVQRRRKFVLSDRRAHAEQMISEAPTSSTLAASRHARWRNRSAEEEIRRVVPVIEALCAAHRSPSQSTTTKSEVARAAFDAGAAIVNEHSAFVSTLRSADGVARAGAGLVLIALTRHTSNDASSAPSRRHHARSHTQPSREYQPWPSDVA